MTRKHPGRGWAGPMGASTTALAALMLQAGDRVRRRTPGWHIDRLFFDTVDDGKGGGGGGGGEKDAAYWEAEARKAFTARDTAKQELRKLQDAGLVVTQEQKDKMAQLEADAAKAEEDRAKKAGEFDKLRQTLTEKHQKDIEERDSRLTTLSKKFQNTVIRAEFGAATDLFGGHSESKTVLDVDMARAVLGEYVHVEDDDTDPRGYRIVVKFGGETIVDGKGNPAPFAEALSEVISKLPNKDRILRGSGKAGSGATGDGLVTRGGRIDVSKLTREQLKDPKVQAQLRGQRRGGGMVEGRAFQG